MSVKNKIVTPCSESGKLVTARVLKLRYAITHEDIVREKEREHHMHEIPYYNIPANFMISWVADAIKENLDDYGLRRSV